MLLAGGGDGAQRAHLEECRECQELIALLESREDGPLRRLDRYDVHRELGRGSMGTVFLAYDPELERAVALKVLSTSGADVEGRLKREARSLARLAHPNVVMVFDVGVFDDQFFMTMEYVDGTSLRAWLREEPRRPDEVIASFVQAGEGLVAAHAAGIVHRDFKPDNVLVGRDGRVRVVDFGLAHADTVAEAPDSVTSLLTVTIRTGNLVGTPAYMAPEQFLGQAADARSDQFAFAVSLSEALFGRRPFAATTLAQLREHTTRGEVSFPRDIPAPLAAILRRALMPRAEDRYPSMQELLAELRRLPTPSKVVRPASAIVAGLALLAMAGGWQLSSARGAARVTAPVRPPSIAPLSPAAGSAASVATASSAIAIAMPLASGRPATGGAFVTRPITRTARPAPSSRPVQVGANDTPVLE